MASSRFEGRIALVTGAGSGIGRAVAIALAREGARVALCGRRVASLRETGRLAPAGAERMKPIAMDVRREPDVIRGFRTADRGLGTVDVLVACHGVNILSRVQDTPLAKWSTVVATNLTGTFLVAREAVRRMVPRGTGRIVIV